MCMFHVNPSPIPARLILTIRFNNICGPHQHPESDFFPAIPIFLKNNPQPLTSLVQKRSFFYVEIIPKVIRQMMNGQSRAQILALFGSMATVTTLTAKSIGCPTALSTTAYMRLTTLRRSGWAGPSGQTSPLASPSRSSGTAGSAPTGEPTALLAKRWGRKPNLCWNWQQILLI